MLDLDNHLSIDQVDSSLFPDEFEILFGAGGAITQLNLKVILDDGTGDSAIPDIATMSSYPNRSLAMCRWMIQAVCLKSLSMTSVSACHRR